jgi:CcmD family protein
VIVGRNVVSVSKRQVRSAGAFVRASKRGVLSSAALVRASKQLAVTIGLLAAAALPSFAQPAAQPATEGFEPVSKLPAVEQLPAAPLLIAAYAFIWLGMLAYVFMLWRRLATVDRELGALRRAIERHD